MKKVAIYFDQFSHQKTFTMTDEEYEKLILASFRRKKWKGIDWGRVSCIAREKHSDSNE